MTNAFQQRYPAYSGFAAVLSGAGLPIYIYAPKYYADTYGVSLTSLGVVLFGLRLFDVVQDPILGWIAERLNNARTWFVAAGACLLGVSMVGLFAAVAPIDPLIWFGITISGLFTAFSFLTINFYALGVSKVADLTDGHMTLAAWRETGALLGVCLAAVIPTLLMGMVEAPFAAFAWGFAFAVAVATIFMWREWTYAARQRCATSISAILSDPLARRLLVLAFVNAAPLAVSSTLFLFFVESRIAAPSWEGPLLVLFFMSAAISAPFWSMIAKRLGTKRVLLSAMVLAVLAFGWAFTLTTGDIFAFAIVCVFSGATIGADLTLIPALFAKRMSVIAPNGGLGFGLWSLVSKFTLAIAAVLLLPVLEGAGFKTGPDNSEQALFLLTLLYALVPILLKFVAIAVLAATQLED